MLADTAQHFRRPSTSQNADVIDKVRTSIMDDRHSTAREITEDDGISRGSANTILTGDLGMRSAVTEFVPKLFSPEQQQLHLEVAQDMLECDNRVPEFLRIVVIGDES
jgi:hypothetical protein